MIQVVNLSIAFYLHVHLVGECSTASTSSCQNGGTCVPGLIATCTCPDTYTGFFCEVEVDPCLLFPCMNNGLCENVGSGAFICVCTVKYTGKYEKVPFYSFQYSLLKIF